MKRRIITLGALTTAFALAIGLASFNNNNQTVQPVEAAQHADNYGPYSYEGTYYNGISFSSSTDGLNGTLRTSLTDLIYPKGWYTYGSSGSDHLSTQLQYADEDPTNSSNMVYLYTRDSVKKNAASSWNREHVWPQSLSNNCWGTSKAGTDILHIRPTYNSTNSARGNDKYADTNKANPLTYNGLPYGYSSGSYFEPLDSVKGDVARIIMYVWTAYKNSKYESASSLPNITNVFKDYDTLLKWHTLDKPDVLEGNRNNYSQTSTQKNRNPYVDHPEYAWKVFGQNCSASVLQACKDAYPVAGSTTATMTGISISGQATVTTYYAGSNFIPNGLTVTASYDDQTTKIIPVTDCEWTPKPLTEGTTTVTCTYNGFTATYSGITVYERPGGSSSNPGGSSNNSSASSNNGRGGGMKKGCHGSIAITTIAVASLGSVVGLVFIFSKKKKK